MGDPSEVRGVRLKRWAVDLPFGYGQIPSHSSRARDLGRAWSRRRGGREVRGRRGRLRCEPHNRPRRSALDHPRPAHAARRGGAVRRSRGAARPQCRRARASAVRGLDLRRSGADRRAPGRSSTSSCTARACRWRRSAADARGIHRRRDRRDPRPAHELRRRRRSSRAHGGRVPARVHRDRRPGGGHRAPARGAHRALGTGHRGCGAVAVPAGRDQRRARARLLPVRRRRRHGRARLAGAAGRRPGAATCSGCSAAACRRSSTASSTPIAAVRGAGDRQVRQRATLYAELEVAQLAAARHRRSAAPRSSTTPWRC